MIKLEKSNQVLKSKNRKLKKTIEEKDFEIKYLGEELSKKKDQVTSLREQYLALKRAMEAKDQIISSLTHRNSKLDLLEQRVLRNAGPCPAESGESALSQFIKRIRAHSDNENHKSKSSFDNSDV